MLASAQAEVQEEPDDPDPEESIPGSRVYSGKELDWLPDDPVEIYYAEFLLAAWVLERAPWNAYHSALAVINNRTQEKALFDYSPEDVSSVMNMVMPQVEMDDPVKSLLFGDYKLKWSDKAKTNFYNYWPDKYSNFVRLGFTNGSVLHKFATWVEDVYAPHHSTFQPIEVAVGGVGNVVRSRMCHDFVTDSLWVFHDAGVSLKAEDSIFRDHIIMYASKAERAEEMTKTMKGRRQWLRYLRGVFLYLEAIRNQFTHGRIALLEGHKLGIPVFLHNQHEDYRIHLVPPFLNYCYLPLAIPPEVHDPFVEMKLCALGMEANMTNSTSPMPWGPMLALEERMDRPEFFASLLLVVLAAACCSSQPQEPENGAEKGGKTGSGSAQRSASGGKKGGGSGKRQKQH